MTVTSYEQSGGMGNGGSPCVYSVVPTVELPGWVEPVGGGTGDVGVEDDRRWVVVRCPNAPGFNGVADIYELGDTPPVSLLVGMARRLLVLPKAQADMDPTPDFGVAQAAVALWVDDSIWVEHSVTASLPGISATLTATPVQVIWDMGEGSDHKGADRYVYCGGPGEPFHAERLSREASTSCSYRYTTTSGRQPDLRFQVVPWVEWTLRWVCEPGCGSGSLDNLVMGGDPVGVRVGEIQALGTNGGVS